MPTMPFYSDFDTLTENKKSSKYLEAAPTMLYVIIQTMSQTGIKTEVRKQDICFTFLYISLPKDKPQVRDTCIIDTHTDRGTDKSATVAN